MTKIATNLQPITDDNGDFAGFKRTDTGAENLVPRYVDTSSGGVAILMPGNSEYPLTGTLLSVTTLQLTANSAALATNSVIPFIVSLRDDLSIGDTTTNVGRIAIPASAKQIRVIASVSFGASEGGTYRRINFNIVANGTPLTSVSTPSIYSGIRTSTEPVIGTQLPSVALVSSLIDVSAWPAPASLGDSYIELKMQHDGTGGSGAQATVGAGSYFSLEVFS